MKIKSRFLEEGAPRWLELELLVEATTKLGVKASAAQISRLAASYRALCADLARARRLGSDPDVLAHLDALTARVHNALYVTPPYRARGAWLFVTNEFPRALRANWRLFLLANALFWLPFAYGLSSTMLVPGFATTVLPAATLEQLAESYKAGFSEGSDGGTKALMAGFYVNNNVSIAFRCFATGILFGAGSAFFLFYNGLTIGTVLGHVIQAGAGANILTFVVGHAPLELTAIVISGAAGLRLGSALVHTQGRTRLGSLRAAARPVAAQVTGAAVMLGLAAMVEGFWSPSATAAPVKWTFAALLTALVVVFFLVGGRRDGFREGKEGRTDSAASISRRTAAGARVASILPRMGRRRETR